MIQLPKDFNWKEYLRLNSDVAIHDIYNNEAGAKEHWKRYGSKENRIYKIDNQNNILIKKETIIPVKEKLEDKKLTIIIPNKSGQTPFVTINSLYEQTFNNFDIIIINDLESNSNKARNIGLKQVKTPYVLFSDNDINWNPTAIEDMINCLDNNKDISYVYGSYNIEGKILSNIEWDEQKLLKNNFISTMSMVRTSHHPGFDENIYKLQDWDVWLTMLEQNKKGKFLGKEIFKTIDRDGITNNKDIKYHEAVIIIRNKHSKIISQKKK